jgi:uncharacterized protein YjbJ (UPF0337 family)
MTVVNTKEKDMEWDQLEDRWKEFAGSARAHWSKLTDDDWKAITGKKEHLVGRIQMRYGIAKQKAERQVDDWSSALQDIVERSKTRRYAEPVRSTQRVATKPAVFVG